MNLIPCTQNCLYQKDGLCALEQAMSSGSPSDDHPCVNYIPLLSMESGQGFANIADADEL